MAPVLLLRVLQITSQLLHAICVRFYLKRLRACSVPFWLDDTLATIGYGLPNGARATECSGHSAVLFYQGDLKGDQVALFRIPVPQEISTSGRAMKRITVAVATSPPVQMWGLAEYLGVNCKFRLFRGDKTVDSIAAMMQRDDDEENRPNESRVQDMKGKIGIARRSVGTLQRDDFEWSYHDDSYSAGDYILGISLTTSSWCKTQPPNVAIGIVVRLEDSTGKCQQLYSQIRARVQAQVMARS